MTEHLGRVLLLASFGAVHSMMATASTLTVLTTFSGANGSYPYASLIFDGAGNLYGTTQLGGAYGYGAVFKLTKPKAGEATWTETVLKSFKGKDGAGPCAGLIFDSAGNLYGTTVTGGLYNDGTVFKLTQSEANKHVWTETAIVSFNGATGANPYGGLIADSSGNVYGTTTHGGPNDYGLAFKLAPPATGQTTWSETIIASFIGTNGGWPYASMIFDSIGNLYGTTSAGGRLGEGTVFRLAPPAAGQTAWTMTVLRPFSSVEGEGGEPTGNVIADSQGNLYGTTSDGGHCASGQPCGGTVFKLRSSGASIWRKKVLGAYYNPMYSYSGLTFDGAGNLYGVAPNYGTSGWVFKLSKPAPGTAPWTTTYVFGFDGTNGSNPYGSLIVDAAGNLYGTALTGGAYGLGTVFMLTP